MKDNRRAPFCYQEVAAMAQLRARFVGAERRTAVAVYQALTEIANEERARARDSGFPATRTRIASYAGVTKRTLDRYIADFEGVGLVAVERRVGAVGNLPNLYVLLSVEGESSLRQVAQSAHEVAQPATPPGDTSDPHSQEEQQEEEEEQDGDVAAVWAYWVQERKPRRADLERAQAKLIRRGLNAGFAVAELSRAIDGLLRSDWHRRNRKLHLSTIFATRPGGPTLRDQIESFIEVASSPASAGAGPGAGEGVSAAAIARAKADVLRAFEMPHNSQAREQMQRAIELLRRHGVEVVRKPDGRPTFGEAAA